MPTLRQGGVLITNRHNFELQDMQGGARVVKTGVAYRTKETLKIGAKTATVRGSRQISPDDLERQVATGQIAVVAENRDKDGLDQTPIRKRDRRQAKHSGVERRSSSCVPHPSR